MLRPGCTFSLPSVVLDVQTKGAPAFLLSPLLSSPPFPSPYFSSHHLFHISSVHPSLTPSIPVSLPRFSNPFVCLHSSPSFPPPPLPISNCSSDIVFLLRPSPRARRPLQVFSVRYCGTLGEWLNHRTWSVLHGPLAGVHPSRLNAAGRVTYSSHHGTWNGLAGDASGVQPRERDARSIRRLLGTLSVFSGLYVSAGCGSSNSVTHRERILEA